MNSKKLNQYISKMHPVLQAFQSLKLTKQVLMSQLQNKKESHSNEAIPTSEYKFLNLLGATIPGLVIETWLAHVQNTLHEEYDENVIKNLPHNAILYAFHADTLPVLLSYKLLNALGSIWIGYHGLLSYVGSFGLSQNGFPCFRYNRKLKATVLGQIETALNAAPQKRFYLFTDSGQPYFRVRKSLVQMSRQTGRPLVPVRHFSSLAKIVNGHQIPLAGTEIRTVVGSPVLASELLNLSDQDAVLVLQKKIDSLV